MSSVKIYSKEKYSHLLSAKKVRINGVNLKVRSGILAEKAFLRVSSDDFINNDDLADFVLTNYRNITSH